MNDYQNEAYKFAIYQNNLYPFLGLAEEAGEVAGIMAKRLRKLERDPLIFVPSEDTAYWHLVDELGDVLWMVAACCSELDVDMDKVMEMNLEKLEKRKANKEICDHE